MSTQTISPESTEMVYTVPTYVEYLKAERSARTVTTPVKRVEKPRKGDSYFVVDISGEYLASGTFSRNSGPTYATVKMDKGHVILVSLEALKKVEARTWVYTSSN